MWPQELVNCLLPLKHTFDKGFKRISDILETKTCLMFFYLKELFTQKSRKCIQKMGSYLLACSQNCHLNFHLKILCRAAVESHPTEPLHSGTLSGKTSSTRANKTIYTFNFNSNCKFWMPKYSYLFSFVSEVVYQSWGQLLSRNNQLW